MIGLLNYIPCISLVNNEITILDESIRTRNIVDCQKIEINQYETTQDNKIKILKGFDGRRRCDNGSRWTTRPELPGSMEF